MAVPQPSEPGERPGCVVGFLILVLIGIIAFSGGLFCFLGARAITTQEFELEWRGGGGFVAGPVILGGAHEAGVEQFRGADAIRIGAALLAGGSVLILWAFLLLLTRIPRAARLALGDGWGARRKLATVHSLVGLTIVAVAVALAPSWRVLSSPGSTAFWLTVSLLCAVVLFHGRRPPAPWAKAVFPALVIGALVAAQFSRSRASGSWSRSSSSSPSPSTWGCSCTRATSARRRARERRGLLTAARLKTRTVRCRGACRCP